MERRRDADELTYKKNINVESFLISTDLLPVTNQTFGKIITKKCTHIFLHNPTYSHWFRWCWISADASTARIIWRLQTHKKRRKYTYLVEVTRTFKGVRQGWAIDTLKGCRLLLQGYNATSNTFTIATYFNILFDQFLLQRYAIIYITSGYCIFWTDKVRNQAETPLCNSLYLRAAQLGVKRKLLFLNLKIGSGNGDVNNATYFKHYRHISPKI